MSLGPGELTVQNLIVPGVGDKAAAVLGPVQVGDKTGMALRRREGMVLELQRAEPRRGGTGLNQESGRSNTEVGQEHNGTKGRIHRPLECGGRARLLWAGPDCDGQG